MATRIESNVEKRAGKRLVAGTTYVLPDERPFGLMERILTPPDYGLPRRYQIIHVCRDDQWYEYQEDMGLASDYSAPQFWILALGEHTVDELRDMADFQRLGDDYWKKRTKELQQESSLIPDFLEQTEERWRVIRNQSVFGPGGQKQRNGFDRRAVWQLQGQISGRK